MDKFSVFLNYIAAIILAAVIFLGLFIVFKEINSEKQVPKTLVIEMKLDKEAKTMPLDKSQVNELKKVLADLLNVSEDLKKRQAEIKTEKDDNFFDKIYTAIIAIVIAIAGFFGFKSVSDIKERAIKDANDRAETIAKSEFSNVFTTEYKAAITKEVTEIIMSKVVKEQIEELGNRISALEQVKPVDDEKKEYNNPKNPFEKK